MIYKLGELCEFINGGAWTQKEYADEGINVVQVTNLVDGTVNIDNLKVLNQDSFERYKKHQLKENDLVIATVGSHPTQENSVVGRASRIPKNAEGYLLNQNAVCIRSITGKLDQKYLVYLGKSQLMKNYIIAHARGSANQVRMPITALKEFSYLFPEIEKQRKIVNILSSYDDLIENNLKRIKLLEESAELLYKEWFINLRYPGYEKHNLIDNMPQKWKKINLYDIADVKMGYAFKANDFNEEGKGVPAIRIRDIPKQTTKTYTTEEVDVSYIVNKGDILIGMDGNFYNDVWAGEEGYLVQRVCRLRAKDEKYQGLLWQAIKIPINYYEKTITGATVAHLGAKHLKEIEILVPSRECKINIDIFNSLYKQKVKLSQENMKLKEARDILISKLIMGEIEV